MVVGGLAGQQAAAWPTTPTDRSAACGQRGTGRALITRDKAMRSRHFLDGGVAEGEFGSPQR